MRVSIFIIFVFSLLFTCSLVGQDDNNIQSLESKQKKYYTGLAFDFNMGGSSKTVFQSGFGFRYTGGYKMNQYLNFGAGIGFEFFDLGDKGYYYSSKILFIPLYGEVRGELTNWKVRPFYQTELGIGFKLKGKYDNFENRPRGLYFRPQIGWKFTTKSDFATTVGFGYLMQKSTEIADNSWGDDLYVLERKRKYQRYFIQFGFEF